MESAQFWNAAADKYFRTPIADEAAYQTKLEITRRYLARTDRVLEVGCGTGATAIAHAPYVAHVTGTDISERMIEYAWSRVDETDTTNVTFDVESIERLEVTRRFDVVMAMSVLHLLRDRAGALQKLHGLIKPGGYFVSSTACLGDRMGYMRAVLPLMRFVGAAPWAAVFKEEQLQREIVSAGFNIVEQYRPEKAISTFFVAQRPQST